MAILIGTSPTTHIPKIFSSPDLGSIKPHYLISTPLKSLLRISNCFPAGSIFLTTFIKVHQGESFFLNRDFMANPDRPANKIKLRVMSMGTVKRSPPKILMPSFFIAMSIMQKKVGSCLGYIAMRQVPSLHHWQKKRYGRFFMMQAPPMSCNPSRNIRRFLETMLGTKFIPTRSQNRATHEHPPSYPSPLQSIRRQHL